MSMRNNVLRNVDDQNIQKDRGLIAVSIVSHGHGAMVERLVGSLLAFPEVAQILVTKNIPESFMLPNDARLQLINNVFPKGFGSNHNAAFAYCTQPCFCPLNPDITFEGNPFPLLLDALRCSGASIVAPLVKSLTGQVEDSIRHFPTLGSLARKAFGGADGRYVVSQGQRDFFPEWVAGMFMLFRSQDFARLNGFDERFFLYYEDVDICVRAWRHEMKVLACLGVSVVHDARRDSHHNLRNLRWHLASMTRYFWRHWLRLPQVENAQTD